MVYESDDEKRAREAMRDLDKDQLVELVAYATALLDARKRPGVTDQSVSVVRLH